jgi:hypothetical protein
LENWGGFTALWHRHVYRKWMRVAMRATLKRRVEMGRADIDSIFWMVESASQRSFDAIAPDAQEWVPMQRKL